MQDVLQSQTKELDKANKVGIVWVTLINPISPLRATWNDRVKSGVCIEGLGKKSSYN